MKSYAIMLLAEGFEESEAVMTLDVLRRLGIDVKLVSTLADGELSVKSCRKISITADMLLTDVNADSVNAVILPGGMPGATNLYNNDAVSDLLKYIYHDNNGVVAAICAAPIVLNRAGLLKNKKYSCYPGFEAQIDDGEYCCDAITVDGRIITGFGPGAAFKFGGEIAKFYKKSDSEVAELFSAMMIDKI